MSKWGAAAACWAFYDDRDDRLTEILRLLPEAFPRAVHFGRVVGAGWKRLGISRTPKPIWSQATRSAEEASVHRFPSSAGRPGLSGAKNLHTMLGRAPCAKSGTVSGVSGAPRGAGERKIMFQYEPFRDSTEHLNDGETLRARLAEDGYLFLRGLLPREAILDVRARLLNKAAEGGWLAPDSPVAVGVANSAAACKDPEPRYMSVFRGLWSDEALHRLRIDPRVIALFDRIFGERALAHPMFVQRNIFPQSDGFDFTTGIHQDRVHIGGATSYAMWMPLGDCPREMGTLAVAAGSHTTGILPTKVGSGAGGMDIAVPIPGTWVTGDFEAGDALIFQDVTVHKALPNRTRSIRMSFDARYQKLSEPMADVNLMPYAGCGSWDEVYAGWSSREGQYYWKDLPITIVPLDRSHYERRDAMAFEMAEAGDRGARDAILRIIQRDPLPEKRRARRETLGTAGRRLTTKRMIHCRPAPAASRPSGHSACEDRVADRSAHG